MAFPNPFRKRKQARAGIEHEGVASSLAVPELFQAAQTGAEQGELPRFSTSAVDLPNRRNDRFGEARLRLRSTYTPSQPVVDPRMFAGRQPLLKGAIRAIEDQRLHLVLFGERGVGKTSLLHMLTSLGRQARYLVIYLPCGAASNFDETFRSVAREIPLLFHRDYAPTRLEAETGATLESLIPDRPLSPRQFGELCAKLTGTRVLVMLDEFDRSERVEFRRDIAELIKVLSDRSARVQLVIAGVASNLTELIQHVPSIRRNILPVPVPFMSVAEVAELLSKGEKASGVVFKPEARDHVIAVAAGSPYIASLICHYSGLAALDAQRTEVIVADVTEAVSNAAYELSMRIPPATFDLIKRLSDEGAGELLTSLAAAALTGGGEFGPALVESAAGTAVRAAAARALVADLTARNVLIAKQDGGDQKAYRFADEAIPSYLWFVAAQDRLKHDGAPPRAKVDPATGDSDAGRATQPAKLNLGR